MEGSYFEASKVVIGLLIAIGLLWPLGQFWYIGVIIGAVVLGWGWKESYNLMQNRAPVPRHRIAGPILIILILANVAKLIYVFAT